MIAHFILFGNGMKCLASGCVQSTNQTLLYPEYKGLNGAIRESGVLAVA